jgi:hypothetical protein
MGQPGFKPRLINTKRGAVIVLCLTGYIAALSFREVLSHSQYKSRWLLDFDSLDFYFRVPNWAVVVVNLAFYAGLVWGAVLFYRMAHGKERALVCGWVTSLFLGLIQQVGFASGAITADYLRALAMFVALLASVDILFRMPASGYPRFDNQTSQNT